MPLPERSTWPRWARLASSAWVLSPLVVFALLIGAFFAYGAYTRSQPTRYARGGDSFAVAPRTTPPSSPAGGAKHQHVTAKKTSDSSGKGAVDGPAVISSTAASGPTSGQAAGGGHVSSGTTTAGPVHPAIGTYALRVSGEEHVKFGPFSACSNTFPTSSSLVVQPAAGEPSGSYDFDQRFYPGSANRHDERHIYRYTSSGVFLTYEEATVTCGGVKQSSTVSYSPAQQRVQLPLSTGATWRTEGGDSGRTEQATFQVVGQQSVTVAGRSYKTWVIDASVSMSGSESGTRSQRWWWAPALGIPLKWHESLSGERSGATYSENVTVSVVGLP